ncbi:MAG: multidrug transporter [Gammaproteobacteria bacterium]
MRGSVRKNIVCLLSYGLVISSLSVPRLVMAGSTASPEVQDPNRSGPNAHAPTAVEMFADAAIVRPLMLGATALGTGIFLVTLPLSLIGGNTDQAAQRLVVEPSDHLLKPCFGCLPSVD